MRLLLPFLFLASGAACAETWYETAWRLIKTTQMNAAQVNLSAEKVAAVTRMSAEAGASTKMEMSIKKSVLETYSEFGPNGQLVDPCFQVGSAESVHGVSRLTEQKSLDSAQQVYKTSLAGNQSSGILGLNKKYTDIPYTRDATQRINRHLGKYCSVSESKAGFCKLQPNGMQAADTDFSIHVVPGKTFGWDQAEAATDYIKTVAPVQMAPQSASCTSVNCVALLQAKRESEAAMSMARYSYLRLVESRMTQAKGDARSKE